MGALSLNVPAPMCVSQSCQFAKIEWLKLSYVFCVTKRASTVGTEGQMWKIRVTV